jgi:hypothetical protein
LVWVRRTGLAVADEVAITDTMDRLLALLPAGAPPAVSQEKSEKALADTAAMTKDHKYALPETALQQTVKQEGNGKEIKNPSDGPGKQTQTAGDEAALKKKEEEAQARAAAEKERQQRAEANARPILSACDSWVKQFDFERASQHIAGCMAKSDDADLKARLQPRAAELQLLAELKTALLDKINRRAVPAFSCVLVRGKPLQGQLVGATADRLSSAIPAGSIGLKWTDFTEPTRYELLKQALDANNGRTQAGMVIYAWESGRANEARQYLEQWKTTMGEPLVALVKQHFEALAPAAPQPAPPTRQ